MNKRRWREVGKHGAIQINDVIPHKHITPPSDTIQAFGLHPPDLTIEFVLLICTANWISSHGFKSCLPVSNSLDRHLVGPSCWPWQHYRPSDVGCGDGGADACWPWSCHRDASSRTAMMRNGVGGVAARNGQDSLALAGHPFPRKNLQRPFGFERSESRYPNPNKQNTGQSDGQDAQ